jgi:hypothetical protein
MLPKLCSLLLAAFGLLSAAQSQCGLDPTSGTTTISSASQIINSYYPGQGNPVIGNMSITVGAIDARGNAAVLSAGDLILIVQMQGADINSTNSDAYGDGIAGGTASGYLTSNLVAGDYEYNSVASVAGSTVNLAFSLANSYFTRTFGAGGTQSFQVIRIPRYYNFTVDAGALVTAPAWNGVTGGMVVVDAANLITINGSINVAGRGFRGGGGLQLTGASTGNTNGSTTLVNSDFRWNSPATTAANTTGGAKGEGIAGTPIYILNAGSTTITTNASEGYVGGSMGRSAPATAGGGASDGAPVGGGQNQYNTGGGGGGNGGVGGRGGSGWHGGSGNVNTYPFGGFGGAEFAQRSVAQFVMGAGGGAGTANNSTAANQYMSSGGAGGGIILLRAGSFAGTGTLNANGGDAVGVATGGSNTDAAGGGGAGGTIIAVTRTNTTVGLNGITATATGGKGGNMETYFDHGPGGGGGGGYIVTNGTFSSTNVAGGLNGFTRVGSAGGTITNSYGSTAGSNGQAHTLASAPLLKNANNAASTCGVLPVLLVSFSGSLNGSKAELSWRIEESVKPIRFELERSKEGRRFIPVATIAPQNGTSIYSYSDLPEATSTVYYRLKLFGEDGTTGYSPVLRLTSEDRNTTRLVIMPTTVYSYFDMHLNADTRQTIGIRIHDASGSLILRTNRLLEKGQNSIRISEIQTVLPGVYFVHASIDGKHLVQKIVVRK